MGYVLQMMGFWIWQYFWVKSVLFYHEEVSQMPSTAAFTGLNIYDIQTVLNSRKSTIEQIYFLYKGVTAERACAYK